MRSLDTGELDISDGVLQRWGPESRKDCDLWILDSRSSQFSLKLLIVREFQLNPNMPNFLLDFTYSLFLPLLRGYPTGEKGNGIKLYVSQKWKCGTYTVLNIIKPQKMKFPGKWVDLECIILSTITQMQKGKHKFIFFLKNRTYHVIYMWLYIRNCKYKYNKISRKVTKSSIN